MSGGSSGGAGGSLGWGNGNGGVAETVSCDALVINTQIATPTPAYIESIRVDDAYEVELQTMGGQQVVVVVRNGIDRIGGLVGGATSRLRDCLHLGAHFRTVVTGVSGPQIRVRIEPKK